MAQSRANKFAFTKKALEAVEAPLSDRVYVYDDRQPGLALCVTSTGSKVFYVYKKLLGEPFRYRLGRYDELTIEQARKAAVREIANRINGENPQEEKRRKREEMTLGKLYDWYIENHSEPHKRPSSVAKDKQNWENHLKHWSGRRLSEIKRSDIQTLHTKIGSETGKYAANHALELLRHMLSKAIPDWLKANPAVGVKRFREVSRERFLSAEELPKFIAAIEAEPREITRDFFKMALFTGARRSNVAAMRWDELNLDRGVWSIPDTKSKNAEPMTVHLPQPAIEILKRRESAGESAEWVFPSWGKCGHISEPKHAMKRILERSGIADVRVHDLRRTLGSWQAATGASLLVIGKSLGHRNPNSTAVYARLDLDPVSAAVDVAVAAMLATTTNQKGGEQ